MCCVYTNARPCVTGTRWNKFHLIMSSERRPILQSTRASWPVMSIKRGGISSLWHSFVCQAWSTMTRSLICYRDLKFKFLSLPHLWAPHMCVCVFACVRVCLFVWKKERSLTRNIAVTWFLCSPNWGTSGVQRWILTPNRTRTPHSLRSLSAVLTSRFPRVL